MNEFLKKHIDTISILTSMCGAILWMNSRFNQIDQRFSNLEKEVAIVKTVLIMQKIMPAELAIKGE